MDPPADGTPVDAVCRRFRDLRYLANSLLKPKRTCTSFIECDSFCSTFKCSRGNQRRALSMLLAPVVWILTAVIAYFFAAKTWWFPPPINAHGIAYDEQFMRTLFVTGIIFVVAQFALGYVIIRFRDDGRRAIYNHGNNRLETVWTSATAILFLGLVLMGTKIWAGVHFDAAPADAVPIE